MPTSNPLRILFLVSAHNSLSQRIFIALTEQGHDVKVEVVSQGHEMEAAVAAHQPELIVCPFLKAFIPESIWKNNRCLVVHPGPQGDRGPSSLDWAVELGMDEWGITLLEADEEADAGDIWATRKFRTREVGKSSLYRHEVRRGAVQAVAEAMNNYGREGYTPTPLDYNDPNVTGRLRPLMKQADRAIDWGSDSTARVVRKIRAAEGHPGVLDTIEGVDFFLFGAHFERGLRGRPGADHRHPQRRDLPRDRRRRRLDHAREGARLLQAARDPRARARGRGLRRAGAPGRRARPDPRRPHVPRDLLRGARPGRLPALRLLQRRDEHRAVPSSARRLPVRQGRARRPRSSC